MMKKLHRRRIELKKKLRGRKRVFAAWTSIAHPSITEIFARSGVDFIGIDIEHSTISQEQSQRIIAACQAEETLCLPRIASHNMEMIKRLLDSGADGIIAPMISTPAEADQLISWCKYPPVGRRSFGVARAQGYGFDFAEYAAAWNRSSSIIVQIESVEGVENIEDILSIRDIDGAMVGPYDLSGSLGIPGRLDHPLLAKACRRVVEACEKYGKSCGTQVIEPDSRSIEKAFEEDFTFIVLASDVFALWKWSERIHSIILPFRTA